MRVGPAARLPVRLPELPPPPPPGVVDVDLDGATGEVAWGPLVWAFDSAGDPDRPFVLDQDVTYTLPPGVLPPEWGDRITVPAGRRSDGPTLGRLGLVAAGVQGVNPYLLFGGSWLHDELILLIGAGRLRIPRAVADLVARLAWLCTPGLDDDDAEEAYQGVRLGTAYASAPWWLRTALRVAPSLALDLLRRRLMRRPHPQ